MALVDVIDPTLKRRPCSWTGRTDVQPGSAHLHAHSPSTVGAYANARWIAATPGLLSGGVRALLEKRDAQYTMVLERGDLAGILCSCDLIGASPADPIFPLMSRRVITIDARATVWMAAKIMVETGVGCLPVTEDAHVIGLLDRERLLEAGIPLEASGAICSACGTHRHVPVRGMHQTRLCLECFERAAPVHLGDHGGIETGTSG